MHIKLSGPQSGRKKAVQALEDAGFPVFRDQFGDPIADSFGEDEGRNCTWLVCEGDDINRANDAVTEFGWRLRAHHEAPSPRKPDGLSLPDRLKLLGIEPDDLRAFLNGASQ